MPDSADGQRSAKRRVVYPPDVPSPAKRARRLSSEENSSPVKIVPSKSFYGGGKGRYLSPLERKKLQELRAKTLSPPEVQKDAPKTPQKLNPPQKKNGGKSQIRKRRILTPKTKKKPVTEQAKPPLQEIDPGSPGSPVKNVLPKEEKRIYSPSRRERKFFKSRRVSDNSSQPSAVVQRNSLHLKYQPQAIVPKPKEEKQKLLSAATRSPKSSPAVKRIVNQDSPAKNTRSSPNKGRIRDSQSSVRSTIASSKNPNSPNLFSLSDWDFADDDDFIPFEPNKDSGYGDSNESKAGEACSASVETESLPGDSVASGSEFCTDKSISPCSSRDVSIGDSNNSSPSTSKVYSIFETRSKSTRNAARDLKKRKTPLQLKNSHKLRSLVDKSGKEQLTLDFGQKLKGVVQCPTCGLTYTHSEPSDEAMHQKIHKRLLSALKFPGWKKENVLHRYMDGSRILVVMPDDKTAMKKVLAVKEIVDEELGFVIGSPTMKSNSKTYLYISEDQSVVGFCVAESITSAFRMVSGSDNTTESSSQTSGSGSRPWCCSTKPVKARCGINRIWVHMTERRRGTASKLLDCVSNTFLHGYPLHKRNLAFTDPTPDGRAFAMKYTGTPNFLVYKKPS